MPEEKKYTFRSKRENGSSSAPRPRINTLPIALAIVIAGILIALGIFASSVYNAKNSQNQPAQQAPANQQAAAAKNIAPVTEADHVRGLIDAKVKIVEYSDLDCPFCKKVHATFQQILKDYDDNEVAWIYRHLPLPQLHPNAILKAQASECAAELGGNEGFWSFVDTLFDNQDAGAGRDEVIATATSLGFDENKFTACLDSEKYKDKVEQQAKNGAEAGSRGTPFTVLVSGDSYIPLSGAWPISTFKAQIDQLLKK